jgi:hypothetical protein
MSCLHVVPGGAPARKTSPVGRRRPSVDWRVVALAGFVLAVVAAEIAIVIVTAPTVDPLAVVAVP